MNNIRLFVIISLAMLAGFNSATAQNGKSNTDVIDSLFLRASSGEVKFQELVEPSKNALIEMGEAAIPQMLTKLNTRDARETHTVVSIFKGIGEIAVEALIGKFDNEDDYVRRLAIRCLADIKSPKAVPDLISYADHDDFRTRAGVVRALGMIGDVGGASVVMIGLRDDNEVVATAAAVACGKISAGIKAESLIKALYNPYYGVRYSAAASLAKLGEAAIDPLKLEFKSKPPVITRCYLIMTLGEIGSISGLEVILDHFSTSDWQIKTYCAEALGKIESNKAKDALQTALKTETHPLVIASIEKALVSP